MNALTAVKAGVTETAPAGFHERLEWMTTFRKPGVSAMSKGWHASITMHVSSVGAEFIVRSDFDCNSPSVALDQCITRMLETIHQLTRN